MENKHQKIVKFLLNNPEKWKWTPSRYNKSVISGFSFNGKCYEGYNLKDAIVLAIDELEASNTPKSD